MHLLCYDHQTKFDLKGYKALVGKMLDPYLSKNNSLVAKNLIG